ASKMDVASWSSGSCRIYRLGFFGLVDHSACLTDEHLNICNCIFSERIPLNDVITIKQKNTVRGLSTFVEAAHLGIDFVGGIAKQRKTNTMLFGVESRFLRCDHFRSDRDDRHSKGPYFLFVLSKFAELFRAMKTAKTFVEGQQNRIASEAI